MVEYSNPEIPEGINYSKEHPLKEFFLLTAGVLGLLFAVLLTLGLMADKLAVYIPFSAEQSMVAERFIDSDKNAPINKYLNSLASRIARAQQLPKDMSVTVHYVDGDTVNAFATLGGNILIFRGLLKKLKSENALAMVMAHEVAHIRYRHPIRSMGRGVVIGIALSMVSSSLGNSVVDHVLGQAGNITTLSYSRDKEREADETALKTLVKLYGNVEGAADLFKVLKKKEKGSLTPEFYSTHPLTVKRLQRIAEFKKKLGKSRDESKKTPLPKEFSAWLTKKEKKTK
jgi:predicted Zn-dependent protease